MGYVECGKKGVCIEGQNYETFNIILLLLVQMDEGLTMY